MIDSRNPAYTASKGRKFAFTLAAAFAVLSSIAYLRHRSMTFDVLVTIGGLMALAGLIIPAMLEPVEKAWMGLAHALSRVTTPIFMAIVYFVVLTPIAFVRRMAGGNPLIHKLEADSYWSPRVRSDAEASRRRMERQF